MLRRRARVGITAATVLLAALVIPLGVASPAAADVRLRVLVVFDDGTGPTPVVGARVRLDHSLHGDTPGFTASAENTGSDGRVLVRSWDNYAGYDAYLRVEVAGNAYAGHRVVPTFENDVVDASLATVRLIDWPDSAERDITVTLRPAASLSGTVQTAGGSSAGNRVAVTAHRQNDSGEWIAIDRTRTLSNGSFVFDGLPIGTYVLETRSATGALATGRTFHPGTDDTDDATQFTLTSGEVEAAGSIVAPTWNPQVDRLSGANRYETSVRTSQRLNPEGGVFQVFIASGESFADALSAAPVAASQGASLLLTPPSSLPAATVAELRRLEPQFVTIVGGTAVVSRAVERRLEDLLSGWGGEVGRIAGDNRYETSARLVQSGNWSSPRHRMFIATGANFADALAAAAAAGSERFPVLLVNGDLDRFSATTIDVLNDYEPSMIYVAGGHSAVSALAVNRWQNDYGLGDVYRFAGSDRFATGELINDFFFDSAEGAVIANGLQFPDALGAAPLAVELGGPLHLSTPDCVRPQLRNLLLTQGTDDVVLVGGTSALSSRVAALRTC